MDVRRRNTLFFGDPDGRKYPLDTPAHVSGALSMLTPDHAGRYPYRKRREVARRIIRANRDLGRKVDEAMLLKKLNPERQGLSRGAERLPKTAALLMLEKDALWDAILQGAKALGQKGLAAIATKAPAVAKAVQGGAGEMSTMFNAAKGGFGTSRALGMGVGRSLKNGFNRAVRAAPGAAAATVGAAGLGAGLGIGRLSNRLRRDQE